MVETQLPVLPHGTPSTLSGLSETFSFHSSPESFITSRVLAFQASSPSLANSRTPIRAKILNRNIAVISSYDHVRQILCDDEKASSLSAGKAYDELMAAFFPPPNLLLSDPPSHRPMKVSWKARMATLPECCKPMVQETLLAHFKSISSGSTVDLYDSMKILSWDLILGIFMSASEDRQQAKIDGAEIELLQEDLLRGQFSLFPVSINTRLWRSPRSKGIAAREKLQSLLRARVKNGTRGCPFVTQGDEDEEDVASHLLLFTSSLAVKALASLLTAIMLNLYIYVAEAGVLGGTTLAARLLTLSNEADRTELLKSIALETERLSPPVVGIMRRTTQDITLLSEQAHIDHTLIPGNWDSWLYFVGASRDPSAFGETADSFQPERYYKVEQGSKRGFAFGIGPKSCLGEELVREIVMTVMNTCIGQGSSTRAFVELQGKVEDIPSGVQGWLGWQTGVKPEEWAKDMKQLPTQRPVKALKVKIIHHDL